jgi:hypothetical protein
VSVAQADEVIIALPGDKSKMSIYEKTPPERGLISTEGFAFCGGFRHLSPPASFWRLGYSRVDIFLNHLASAVAQLAGRRSP